MERPAGLAEESRLFYMALTGARDQRYLCAQLCMHHHRMSTDDRHGYGQLPLFPAYPNCASQVRER